MNITRVWETKRGSFFATIDGNDMSVPKDTANRHYQAILSWLEDGNKVLFPEDHLSQEEYILWIESKNSSLS